MGKRKSPESTRDIRPSVMVVFKLEHLHPFEPILFWKFSICFIFILGGQFLLPQRANSEKGEFSQFQI